MTQSLARASIFLLVILAALLAARSCLRQQPQEESNNPKLEHLTISGVAIHSPYDDVPAKLGNPKQLEDGVFEFPGHIIVDVEDGKVDRIEGDVIERDGRKIISRESFREDVVRQLGPPDSPPETKDSIDYFSTSGYNVFIELTPTAKGLRVSRVMLRAKRR